MNPVVIGRGRSFKGLAQYILHDQKATTAERVGFVETHNLSDAPPDRAWRLMAGTAKNANAIKEAAGLRRGGQQNKKPAYHFVLTWPEEDAPSPDLQRRAVKESLAALGMSHLQSMAVQHLDGKPHVHVMVNTISPEDGTTAKLSNDHKKLSAWAKKFELAHGLKVTEGRVKNEFKRKAGEQVDARRKPRNVYDREQREGKDRRTAWLRQQEQQIAETLSREGKQMKNRHAASWTAAKEAYAARKSAIYDARDRDIKTAIEDVKARYKSKWAQEFQAARDRVKTFDKSEKSGLSRMANRLTTFWKARNEGADVFTSVFTAATHEQRRDFLETENLKKREALHAQQREDIAAAVADIKRRYGMELDTARVEYLGQCDQLKKDQDTERADHRTAWRDYNERRKQNHARMTGDIERTAGQRMGFGYGYSKGHDPYQE